MKKKGLLTTTFMMVAMLPGTLQAKVSKTKKPIKKKTLAANTKSKNISRKKITSSNSGIYSIPKNNKSELVVEKMNELKKYHEKVLHSGTAAQKKKVFTQKKLLTSYSHWKGTKYALGGDSKKGIDCSALTRQVYREVYKKELPRVSAQQVKSGKRVANKNLEPGDILFFKTNGGKTNHTTVYVGNTLFINASSSKGVVMSSLKSPYWNKSYKYGVRVKKA